MNRHALTMCTLLCLAAATSFADSSDQRQIAWSDFQQIVGKKVRVAMPDGTRVEGKAIAVEPDALSVQVSKTSNARVHPKGKLLVARATLKSFDVKRTTYHWRVIGACLGVAAGVVVLALVTVTFEGVLGDPTALSWAAAATLPVAGYLLGNRADQRVTTYVVTE